VLKQRLYPRDMTEPMWHTPRECLYERGLRGRWALFPVSPEPFYERLSNGLGEGFRANGQTFKLARRLEAAIERIDRTTAKSAAERLAARRALVAWCYRTMQRCDDSYRVIGELARDVLIGYATLSYEPAGIAGPDWCEDASERRLPAQLPDLAWLRARQGRRAGRGAPQGPDRRAGVQAS